MTATNPDLSRIIIDTANAVDGEYHVWIPPIEAADFDTDGFSHLGAAGDSYWPSLAEATQFVASVFADGSRSSLDYMEAPNP